MVFYNWMEQTKRMDRQLKDGGSERSFQRSVSRLKIHGLALFLLTWGILACPAAWGNGNYEDRPWQFQTTADRANKALIQDFILRKQAGGYIFENIYNNTYTITYEIDGHYIDCNVTSQAMGNEGSVAQDAPMGEASIEVSNSTSSTATGNSSEGTVTSGDNTIEAGIGNEAQGGDTLTGSAAAGDTTSFDNTLSNDGSQESYLTDSPFASTVESVSGSGGEASVTLNSSQGLENATVTSAIYDSDACNFNFVSSDSFAVPLNTNGDF